MVYRLTKLPEDRVAIIMPVDHGLIFNRLPGLETWPRSSSSGAQHDVTEFMMTPGQVKQEVDAIDTLQKIAKLNTGPDLRNHRPPPVPTPQQK